MEATLRNITVESDQHVTDERLMSRALELAAQGTGQVSPSPLVGCVIVDSRGEIVGEGFYRYDHRTHAEILALEQAGSRARGGTAYVTLEPHAHHSRTPPCTDALIAAGIARVVYALDDPNPLVSGRGGEALRTAGVEVTVGVLAREAARQNEVYLYNHATGRPFVHLKLACSLDGKIAARKGISQWLTGEESRARVHELRHQYDAILIGANTARIDDPLLTDRSGLPRRRPLIRVVLNHHANLKPDSKLLNSTGHGPMMVYTAENASQDHAHERVTFVPAKGPRVEPDEVLVDLYARGVQSVLIEGGPTIATSFLTAGLVDKVTILLAPVLVGGEAEAPRLIGGTGLPMPGIVLHDTRSIRRGEDVEITGYPRPDGTNP